MRLAWRDRDRTREVEVKALGSNRYRVVVDGVESEVQLESLAPNRVRLTSVSGDSVAEITATGPRRFVRLGSLEFVIERETAGRRRRGADHGGGLEAPMPGVVTRVLVGAGDAVQKGQPLLALEAMKMEHVIRAPRDGRVRSVSASLGEMVNGGAALVELEEEEAAS